MKKYSSIIIGSAVLFISAFIIILAMNQKAATTNGAVSNASTTASSSSAAATETATKAVIKTEKGDIEIELRPDKAPKTVANFVKLAKEGFYDGLTFHRRVENFVLQGGDPDGNGTGGPGYTVPAEITDLKHTRGALATARLGDEVNPTKASSGSQFYITLDDIDYLDGNYTVFGYVTKGMEVVDQLQMGDVMLSIEVQ